MKIYRLLSILVMLAMLFGPSGGMGKAQAKPQQAEISLDALYVPGEVIVAFRPGFATSGTQAAALDLAGQVGAQVVKVADNIALLQFDENADVPGLAALLSGMQGVAYAEPNYIRWIPEMQMDAARVVGHPQPRTEITFRLRDAANNGQTHEITLSLSELRSMTSIRDELAVPTWPTDPDVWTQWGWYNSNASLIWPDRARNPGVCVVDTGVDRKHPDLAGRVLPGYDFVNMDSRPDDDNGHGTHVAGTIAASTNNGKGFAGISTAKIVPVKVLSAQGWGTAFDIAQGIRYCANRRDVKIINLSLGGSEPSRAEYDALNYAINTKGKLVVAAAGNDSMAYYDGDRDNDIEPNTADMPASFPAGWAVSWVCKNGTLAPSAPTPNCIFGNENTLANGLISVGAGNWWFSYDSDNDGLVWVDVDGNSTPSASEQFNPLYCLTEFSNYGAWVEIVAPGKGIYSTVPVSYDYHMKSASGVDPDGDGYDWLSGTSMAAPHVAGAAARVWSAFPTANNFWIESRLAHSGISMPWRQTAVDPNMSNAWEGYDDTGYQGEAPFCWPDSNLGALYDMTYVPYLDVAGAMNRTALWQPVFEAITGLPLEGATVMAYSRTRLSDRAIVNGLPWVALINLPASLRYTIKVSRAGYTSGAVDVYPGMTPPWGCGPGLKCDLPVLSIPPIGRITAVANWGGDDLDLYTWLPSSSPNNGSVVGPVNFGHTKYVGTGSLSVHPYAIWNSNSGWYNWLGLESITIVPKPGSPTTPYYNQNRNDYYAFLLTDYGNGNLNQPDVMFRFWVRGKIVPGSFVWKSVTCDTDGADNTPGTADDEVWWYAGYIRGNASTPGAFQRVDQCGTSAMWPY